MLRTYEGARLLAALESLSTETIQVRRRIVDRHGVMMPAIIEYTPEQFASKLVDALEVVDRQAYMAPELRRSEESGN